MSSKPAARRPATQSPVYQSPVYQAPVYQAPVYLTATLAKGLGVLDALAEVEDAGLSELARRLDVSGPTLFRLLATLIGAGYVRKTSGRYRLSLKLWELGAKTMRRLTLRDIARPHMERLVARAGEAAHLAVLEGAGVVIIEKVDTVQPVRVDTFVGQRAPAHGAASGKAILAFASADVLSAVMSAPLARFTESTVCDRRQLERELALTRKRGYALNRGEWRHDVCAVGVPVHNHTDEVIASLSLTMPTQRFTEDAVSGRFLPELAVAAAAISADFGRR
jgi:DNA-binding IclR family transcriptional regulator